MIPTTLAEVARATGGRLGGGADPGTVVDGPVVVDSRQAVAGGLFVALPGERVDGADYVATAAASGAAVLAQRPVEVPHVLVEDGQAALGALAAAVRARLPGLDVVGITGSSGKTSTKDLLGALLAGYGPTIAPQGSFNNEIGVPLTVLRAEESTRFLVVEMGARGRGHIASLCQVARPRVGVVLNVGLAHAGEFGGQDAIAVAKGELVEALPAAQEGGVAVLGGDDERVRAMRSRTRARVVLTGTASDADVRADGITLDGSGRPAFTLVAGGTTAPVAMRMHGEHHVANACAAAGAALALGVPAQAIAPALSAAVPGSRWRMEVAERADGVTVVNDAYNANPDSVRAALRALVAIGHGGGLRRTWAVLGEMLELGELSATEHDAVGRLAVRLNVSRLVAVGEGARAVHSGARHEGSWGEEADWVPDADAALALLREQVRPGDVVLVKASRSVGLERVAEALLADVPGPGIGGGGAQA